jgi:hypothetical protein
MRLATKAASAATGTATTTGAGSAGGCSVVELVGFWSEEGVVEGVVDPGFDASVVEVVAFGSEAGAVDPGFDASVVIVPRGSDSGDSWPVGVFRGSDSGDSWPVEVPRGSDSGDRSTTRALGASAVAVVIDVAGSWAEVVAAVAGVADEAVVLLEAAFDAEASVAADASIVGLGRTIVVCLDRISSTPASPAAAPVGVEPNVPASAPLPAARFPF